MSSSSLAQPVVHYELKLLQDYKKELVTSLRHADLVKFSEELFMFMVISKDVKDMFASLDHDRLDPGLRVRYLLQHVCERVKQDGMVFHKFHEVLATLGGSVNKVCRCLSEELDKRVSKREADSEGQSSGGAGSNQAVVDDIFLSEEHVPILSEVLVEVSDKWEVIGISLGLPRHIREECRKGNVNTVRLTNILSEWIIGNYQHSVPATLSHLKLKLASQFVREGKTALNLEERFAEAMTPLSFHVAKKPRLYSTLTIDYQSSDTLVADGKSTLLEVQVSPNEAISYRWMKDGQSLSDNLAYSGTCSDILVISFASQGTEGKYSCYVSNGRKEVNTAAVILTVSYPLGKKRLINLYSLQRELPSDSWPPVGTSTFINLALINRNKQYMDDYNYSVRGYADEILESKEKVSYEEVFSKYESGALVLVEGRPGSGKTTFVHKVTRDWATKGNSLKSAKLIFLITRRHLDSRNVGNLSNIFDHFYRDKEEQKLVLDEVVKADGEGVCFIIDGLDEYQPEEESKSVIYQLIYKTYLPKAMVIVASRPVATATLKYKAVINRQVEVLGFSKQQFFEYIDNFPFRGSLSSGVTNSNTIQTKLKMYLDSHHNVLQMCYLPVHAAMICFLYQHEKGNIPPTETQIYEQFTKFIVLRKQRRSNEKAQLISLKDICGKDKEYFSKICLLAFNMTVNFKQAVRQSDTDVPLSHDTGLGDEPSLGLVTIDRIAELAGFEDVYTFLHLTFQEYLAAFHIANLTEDDQIEIIRLHGKSDQMRMVWKFYCGMVKFDGTSAHLKQIITSRGCLYGVQCAYESQQEVVCDRIVKKSKGVLDFSSCFLTPADLTAINYVISTTSGQITCLSMWWCNLNGEDIRKFLNNSSNLKFLRRLCLSYNNIGSDGALALVDGLKYCKNLCLLNLDCNNIGSDGAMALADGLKYCNNLQKLYLEYNYIGSDGAVALANGLKCCNNLVLRLNNNN